MSGTEIGVLVAFWVVLGAGLAFLAVRGRLRRHAGDPSAWAASRAFALGLGALFVVFGLAVPIAAAIVSTDNGNSTPSGSELTAAQVSGRELFTHNCSNCHTLSASSAAGRVGPNLDEIRPNQALTLNAIEQGRARGNGVMPPRLVTGQQAEDIADYVAAVAGR